MWKWLTTVFPSEHEWATQQLSAYLDTELSPADRDRVEAHLKECRTCVEELSTLRWTVNLTGQIPMLKAPRSFLITQSIAQPRGAPLDAAYVYLRSATVAVAALLLLVLAGDFLLSYPVPPAIPAPQTVMRKALPAVVEVQVEKEVIKEIPVEKVVEEEVVVEKEVVREVQVEKEAEEAALPMAPAPVAEKEVVSVLAGTPTPEDESAKMELEAKEVAPGEERMPKEDLEQEPAILTAPPAERAPEMALSPTVTAAEVEQEAPAEEGAVVSTVVPATPTSERAVPTSTPPLPRQRIVEKAILPLRPTPLPLATAVAGVIEPARLPFSSWRSALRLAESGLGLLVILLAGSTLVLRLRHR